MQYIIDRLREPSTWRGIAMIVALLGVKMQPEMVDAITTAGIAVIGVIDIAKKG